MRTKIEPIVGSSVIHQQPVLTEPRLGDLGVYGEGAAALPTPAAFLVHPTPEYAARSSVFFGLAQPWCPEASRHFVALMMTDHRAHSDLESR